MYVYIGKNTVIRKKDIVAVFDLDSSTVSVYTRKFLAKAEKEGRVELLCDDIPKSFIITDGGKIYLSPFNTSVYRQEDQSIPKKEK